MIVVSTGAVGGAVPGTATMPSYEDISPILEDNCTMCHNGPKAPKGLRLDTYENVLKGSENGPVVKQRDPQGSELIRRLRGISTPRMPLSGPPWLEASEVRMLEEWIANGAPRGSKSNAGQTPVDTSSELKAEGPKGTVTYKDVAPIFKASCIKCHNHKGLMGPPPEGLVLASYREIISGTERTYVVPGNPDASELLRKVRGQSLPRMPFDGPPYLTADQINVLEKWIAQGAKDYSGKSAEMPVGRKVRLRGRLSASWKLDGLPLNVNGSTEVKKKVSVGDYVDVRGRVTNNGGIVTERISVRKRESRRSADDDQE